jgi:hypothetical protein
MEVDAEERRVDIATDQIVPQISHQVERKVEANLPDEAVARLPPTGIRPTHPWSGSIAARLYGPSPAFAVAIRPLVSARERTALQATNAQR